MAYTPDKAFDDLEEVGHKAFLLYSFFCKHGSMSNNVVSASLESGAKFVGVVYENACRLSAKLKKAGWIKHKNGKIILIKGYENLLKTDENVRKQSKKTDENNSFQQETDENVSFYEEQKPVEIPKTDENNSQKLTKTTVAYKGRTSLSNQQENTEREKGVGGDFVSPDFQTEVEENLFWVQRQKGLKSRKNFPETEWADLIGNLSAEGIGGDGFKEFYQWVENLDWVETVSPNLLKGQIEKYLNREKLAEKKKLTKENGGQNGQIQPNSNGNGAGKPNPRPSNCEISRSRDYSRFDGLDPIKAFPT